MSIFCNYSIGPLTGALIVRFTHRVVASVGTILVAVSYVGLAYSTHLAAMIISFSIIGGKAFYHTFYYFSALNIVIFVAPKFFAFEH